MNARNELIRYVKLISRLNFTVQLYHKIPHIVLSKVSIVLGDRQHHLCWSSILFTFISTCSRVTHFLIAIAFEPRSRDTSKQDLLASARIMAIDAQGRIEVS